jgi:hypothetical protein
MDTTERDAGMLLVLHRVALVASSWSAGYWLWRSVALVVLAVANGGSAQLLGDDLDGGPGAGVAEVEPASASQPWRYVRLILYGWGYRVACPLRQCLLLNECSSAHDDQSENDKEPEPMPRLIRRSIAVAVVSIAISLFVSAVPAAHAAPVNCVHRTHQGACWEFVWVHGVEVRMTFP